MRTKLTPREIQVLKLLSAGMSNIEIGLQLETSEATVKQHIRNIFDKIGMGNRVEASMWAIEHGYIHLDMDNKRMTLVRDLLEEFRAEMNQGIDAILAILK